jgi:hypothetical protein
MRILHPTLPPLLSIALVVSSLAGTTPISDIGHSTTLFQGFISSGNNSALANFSGAIDRLVTIVGAAGGGLLALVWARVAMSWFSNDVGKKIQAKERARDALVGTLLFVAALSGLLWGLARWVVGS